MDTIRIVIKDHGVDGTEILGFVSDEKFTETLMYVIGYNRSRQGEMSGVLDIVNVTAFEWEKF